MALDVSEAIELAKDLLATGNDFRPHDPAMAAEFSSRAFEICDDLGIDRALIGAQPDDVVDDTGDDDNGAATVEMAPTVELTPAEDVDEEARETSDQLRDLLQQQARVLQSARQTASLEAPKAAKRSFRLFGRGTAPGFGKLQSASA